MKYRWSRWIVALAVLLAALAGAAVIAALSTGPAFIAGAMSQVLQRHVSIGGIQVRAGLAMYVDLQDVRVHETTDPASAVLLEAPRAQGRQLWPRVIVGQLVPLAWSLESPVLRADLRAAEQGKGGTLEIPAFDLTIRDGRLELKTTRGDFLIDGLGLRAERGVLLPTVKGTAEGALHRGKDDLGRFALVFSGTGIQSASIGARLEGVNLSVLGQLGLPLRPRGTLAGQVAIEVDGEEISASGDLLASSVSFRLPTMDRLSSPQVRLAGKGRWTAKGIEAELDPFAIDDIVLRGPISVTRGESGRFKIALTNDTFAPGKPGNGRLNPLLLLGLKFQTFKKLHDSIEGGVIEGCRLDLDMALSELPRTISFLDPPDPSEFTLRLKVKDGVYRTSEGSEPFVNIRGGLDILGDLLRIYDAHGERFASALPQIDIDLHGFGRLLHLQNDMRYIPSGPGVATPGLYAAISSLLSPPAEQKSADAARDGVDAPQAKPQESAPKRDFVIRASDVALDHAALILPVRHADAVIRFPGTGLIVDPARGLVAGGMADVKAEWDRPNNKVSVEVRYDYSVPNPYLRDGKPEDNTWVRGRFDIERLKVGRFPVESVSGRLHVNGAAVDVTDVTGKLATGTLTTSGTVSLAEEGRAPIAFAIDLVDADVATMAQYLAFGGEKVTGRGDVRGPVRGALSPDTPFVDSANMQFDVDMRDGDLRDLPEALQIARLPSGQGILGLFGRAMPYRSVEATFVMQNAVLRTERFTLLGPELRILAGGEIDLRTPEQQTDMLVALLFVQTLDRMIEKVPVLGDWVLGKDQSLLAIYVRLQGPFKDPSVALVPPGGVQAAAGFAGRMISKGVRGLRDLVVPAGPRTDPTDPQPEPQSELPSEPPSEPRASEDEPPPPPPAPSGSGESEGEGAASGAAPFADPSAVPRTR